MGIGIIILEPGQEFLLCHRSLVRPSGDGFEVWWDHLDGEPRTRYRVRDDAGSVITDFHDFDSNKDGVTDTTRSKTSIETAACAESESRRQIH